MRHSTICDPKPRKGQILCHNFYKNVIKWLDQLTTHSITLAWCPGHSNIRGNERADELAKAATEQPGTTDTTITCSAKSENTLHKHGSKFGKTILNRDAMLKQTGFPPHLDHHPTSKALGTNGNYLDA